MKTYQIKFLLSVLFIFGGVFGAEAQGTQTINVKPNANQLVFDVENNTSSGNNDLMFILFGDGDYSRVIGDKTGLFHKYPSNTIQTSYNLMVFKAKKGDPIDPFGRVASISNDRMQTIKKGISNPRLSMLISGNPTPIKLDRSWDLSPDEHAFIIIALDKIETGDVVYFDYSTSDLDIDLSEFTTYNPHQANASLVLVTGVLSQRITISNLKSSKKQTHLFIKVKCVGNAGETGSYSVELNRKEKAIHDVEVFEKKGYPHDPNYIEVDKTISCNQTNPGRADQLIYKVHFQNEGNAFADHVEVEVDLDDNYLYVDRANINMLSTNIFSGQIKSITSPKVVFRLSNIKLPGTNQIDKSTNTFYTYDESCAFITFAIDIRPIQRQAGYLINAQADITFIAVDTKYPVGDPRREVSMKPIQTDIASTEIIDDCQVSPPWVPVVDPTPVSAPGLPSIE